MAFVEQTRLNRFEVAVETAEGVELWLAEIPAALLRIGVILEFDDTATRLPASAPPASPGTDTGRLLAGATRRRFSDAAI